MRLRPRLTSPKRAGARKKNRAKARIFEMGWKTGFEPATLGTTNQCSNQLSYIHRKNGAEGSGVGPCRQ